MTTFYITPIFNPFTLHVLFLTWRNDIQQLLVSCELTYYYFSPLLVKYKNNVTCKARFWMVQFLLRSVSCDFNLYKAHIIYHYLWPATIVVIFYLTSNYHEQVVALIYRYTKQLALSAICQHVTHHSNSWILQPGPNHGLFYWGMKCITEYQYLKILYPSFKLLKTLR